MRLLSAALSFNTPTLPLPPSQRALSRARPSQLDRREKRRIAQVVLPQKFLELRWEARPGAHVFAKQGRPASRAGVFPRSRNLLYFRRHEVSCFRRFWSFGFRLVARASRIYPPREREFASTQGVRLFLTGFYPRFKVRKISIEVHSLTLSRMGFLGLGKGLGITCQCGISTPDPIFIRGSRREKMYIWN